MKIALEKCLLETGTPLHRVFWEAVVKNNKPGFFFSGQRHLLQILEIEEEIYYDYSINLDKIQNVLSFLEEQNFELVHVKHRFPFDSWSSVEFLFSKNKKSFKILNCDY